ncbi:MULTISPECIES: alpha-galactosidase [unclassified Enterococcus]|uniref:alpha-galactosidase n=1 Tax=unclassified Enterococcus TaxID=2608891 RepID=UPI001551DF2C|nr:MULTISPECIES: alpha-galactosidase [unclassified Enterococcus]MBS7578053.1 alpha-galactosidase [Enterococcus sp. MMGLQ5-2]MBS7585257.1 alpha-galactosidase [Enterococcus sp. MMGLQ5-1]NPD13114.1 alpha-galactosidase [Enterococcus sp. MMGLQ5-1]NPD37884.1 alpha-galactosidase [Enterococcus sp. MMGLQ5-2]
MNLIKFDEKNRTFHLSNGSISYLLGIENETVLSHLYFGKAIKHYHNSRKYPTIDRSFSPNPAGSKVSERGFSLDTLAQEYPSFGHGDFRNPAFQLKQQNGSTITEFKYHEFEIIAGKPVLKGLPASYVVKQSEAETLIISLIDSLLGVTLKLFYTIYANRDVVVRSSQLINHGTEQIVIEKIASASLDFPADNYELISLPGRHIKEREIQRETVQRGIKIVESKRGASSHQANPFVALVFDKTDEFTGEAFGISLVYSGNHEFLVETDQFKQTRLMCGINPYTFSWVLSPKDQFQTPEALIVYSDEGLNGMSQTYHQLLRERLARGKFQYAERPILINNWEATYFDFDAAKIKGIVDQSAALGIELFVLDDGWFGKRDDDISGLGDWYENTTKLKGGLKGIADYVHDKNMKFGLWFEPEMINQDSDLYREHPDYAIQTPNRSMSTGRDQLVLDFTRADVRNNITEQMRQILNHVEIDYIKWDMNRHITEAYSQSLAVEKQGEFFHRYILGLYEMLEALTTEYPNILWEGCSGGGGRFDAGFIYYMPQSWTSDNTDAIDRLDIQYGTSLVYPPSSMGAHVSAVPNHQTGRITGLDIRGDVAMGGVFGYELDLRTLTAQEKKIVKQQVSFYKHYRQLLQYGKFYRMISPFESNLAAWSFVNEDQTEAIAFYFSKTVEAAAPLAIFKFVGLDADKQYRLGDETYGGDELMNVGIYINPQIHGDYQSRKFILKAI